MTSKCKRMYGCVDINLKLFVGRPLVFLCLPQGIRFVHGEIVLAEGKSVCIYLRRPHGGTLPQFVSVVNCEIWETIALSYKLFLFFLELSG